MTTKVETSRSEQGRRLGTPVRNTAIIVVPVLWIGLPLALGLVIEGVDPPVFQLTAGVIAGLIVGLVGRLGWRCLIPAFAGGATAGLVGLVEWWLAEPFYRGIVDGLFGHLTFPMPLILGFGVMIAVWVVTLLVSIAVIVGVTRRVGESRPVA